MGCYDGAETCELVGNFLLSQIQKLNINIGLCRVETDWSFQTPHRETQKTSKKKYAPSSIKMDYGSPSKPTNRPSFSFTSLSNWIKTPSSPSQSLTPHYNTSTARATTRQPPQRTNPRHQQKAIIPFIWQSILRPSRSAIPKSTRWMRIPVHSTLRTTHD